MTITLLIILVQILVQTLLGATAKLHGSACALCMTCAGGTMTGILGYSITQHRLAVAQHCDDEE